MHAVVCVCAPLHIIDTCAHTNKWMNKYCEKTNIHYYRYPHPTPVNSGYWTQGMVCARQTLYWWAISLDVFLDLLKLVLQCDGYKPLVAIKYLKYGFFGIKVCCKYKINTKFQILIIMVNLSKQLDILLDVSKRVFPEKIALRVRDTRDYCFFWMWVTPSNRLRGWMEKKWKKEVTFSFPITNEMSSKSNL